jgi:RNA polymerase sigma factor (sigma-70 family)
VVPITLSREAQLHGRLVRHDLSAFVELYDEYAAVVHAVARRVTGHTEHADDVCQIVFLQVWEHPERFDPARGSFRPWLATFAHHRSVDRLREEESVRRRDERSGLFPLPDPDDVEEVVETVISAEHVRRALATLPAIEREPISLAYFANRTYREVAVDLDLPEGTVKSRILRGLRHLEHTLRPDVTLPAS